MAQLLTYTGEALSQKDQAQGLDAYIPSDELKDAVNLTLQLKRPLLLMGDPGCGKTRLAEAVAFELHGQEMDKYFFKWHIKSTTKAKDGVYQYDALQRLYDVNMKLENQRPDIANYISFGPLAKALTTPQNGNKPNVLLIDEIDKASIDFPNDLLLELDQKKFFIPELQEEREATSEVIIFITSNQEKELPPAFLRRCLFQYIEFPSNEKLKTIIDNHVFSTQDEFIDKAIKLFLEKREEIEDTDKKPSTSELIDWFKMIDTYMRLKTESEGSRSPEEQRLIDQLDLVEMNKIPFKQVLFKTLSANQTLDEE